MATWFTADHHFGHANILRLAARPFTSAADMDNALIARWNGVVAPSDVIWHLGDFCFRNGRSASDYLRCLNGEKNLVWGNHDSGQTRDSPGWASSQAMAEIVVDSQRLVLFHYAMRVWPRSGRGSWHLYGHSHGRLPGDSQSLDVGVDSWEYRPVGMDQIRRRLRKSPPRPEFSG